MSDSKEYIETFYIVPRYIRKFPGITLAFLDVYETIYQFWNKGLTCFLSNTAIMERTGVKITQVKDAIAFFEKNNLLIRQKKGLKRYLIQPRNSIETDQEAAPPASSINNNQVAAPPASGGRSSGHLLAAPPATEYKEVEYKELNVLRECGHSHKKNTDFHFDIKSQNPHGIPDQMIDDWISLNDKKITPTRWNKINSELEKCKQYGVTPVKVFEDMVAGEWKGLESRWYKERMQKASKIANEGTMLDHIWGNHNG